MDNSKVSRKDQILQALAQMLESAPGERITTAGLAKEVGVSEAALYRHFPSKARMFEGLIKFIARVLKEETNTVVRCHKILTLLLAFSDKNPGMTRLLTGDALAGETERLRERIEQFYSRLEAQLKQILREAQIRENLKPTISASALANLLLASCEGRLVQFVRSEFKNSPLEYWDLQWEFLSRNLLEPFNVSTAAG
jgi:TetR/AcrR family transcriptional regulator